jgi:hypothetical protein
MGSHHTENNSNITQVVKTIYNVQVRIVADGSQAKWMGTIPVVAESIDIAKMLAARVAKSKDEYTYGDKVEILFIYK